MSTVYKAVDLRFANVERICAVKEMFDAVADEQTRQQRLANFEREAGLLAVLSHPLIPKIFDYFPDRGNIYLVQEFIPGQDLETVIEQIPGGLPEAELLDWGMQICDVLSYLHTQASAPIIFRDMKPSNIMMRDDRSLMVIDFGIARSLSNDGARHDDRHRGLRPARTVSRHRRSTHRHLRPRRDTAPPGNGERPALRDAVHLRATTAAGAQSRPQRRVRGVAPARGRLRAGRPLRLRGGVQGGVGR